MINALMRRLGLSQEEPESGVYEASESELRYDKARQQAEVRIIRAERNTERITRMPSWEELYVQDRGR